MKMLKNVIIVAKQDFINLDKHVEKIIRGSEKNIYKGYKDSLDYLKKEMANLYEKYSVDGKLTSDAMNKYNRIIALEKDISVTVSMMYQRNNREIAQVLRKTFLDTSKSIVSIVEKDIGMTLKPIIKPIDVTRTINKDMKGLKWAERQGKNKVDLVYDLQKTVKEGISNGDTYKTMAKRLNKSMDISINKANTIARTETSRVMADAQKQTLDKVANAGVKMKKTWNNVLDERSRDTHIELDGKTIPYDEDFTTPLGNKGFGPKQLDDNGEDSIQCRCFLSISFE